VYKQQFIIFLKQKPKDALIPPPLFRCYKVISASEVNVYTSEADETSYMCD